MFNNEVLSAICRTFLHSIWQGILAAIIAGMVLLLTRRSTARTRYNLLGSILLLSVVASVATLFLELQAVNSPAPVFQETGNIAVPPALVTASYWDVLLNYLNVHAPLIMLIWSIIFIFKCFRMGFSFYQIHRIRHYQTSAPDGHWNARMQELTALLGIRRPVRLIQSAIVQVPLTTGFIRPCIFIPLGLLARMQADQVEAILLHELAHIRRSDYLVNILQSFTESIFFFNPALLWISATLREEREACCDDVALAHTPHKASYMHALVAFAAHSSPAGQLQMAISHKQNPLLNRVKRMMTRENKKLSIMEKSVLILGLIVISAFSLIPEQHEIKQPEATAALPVIEQKTVPPAEEIREKTVPSAIKKDTVTPQKKLQDSSNFYTAYTYHIDTNLNINTNVNLDSFQLNLQQNFDVNYVNQILHKYNLAIKKSVSTNTDGEILYLKIDSARMQYYKHLQIDSSKMQYLKKAPLRSGNKSYTALTFEYTADSTIKGLELEYSYAYKKSLKKINPDADTTKPLKTALKKDSWKSHPKESKDTWKKSPKNATVKPLKSKDTWKKSPPDSIKSKDKWKNDPPDSFKSKPAKPKTEKPSALKTLPGKPALLEEKLPQSFYNSLILPKRINC